MTRAEASARLSGIRGITAAEARRAAVKGRCSRPGAAMYAAMARLLQDEMTALDMAIEALDQPEMVGMGG